jgi:hypothetical protein
MRFLRLIIISIIFLLLIITIISLFIPSKVRISRAVQIHTSQQLVMEQINDPAKWKNWYPGADSARFFYENGIIKGLILNETKRQYIIITSRKESEVMAVYTLPDRKIGTGWQVIPANDSNSATVQWYMDFHLHWYPWEKFSSFMFERIYGPQLEKGLNDLKTVLENDRSSFNK